MSADLLDDILGGDVPAYALLHRPDSAPDSLDVLAGQVRPIDSIAEIPVPAPRGHAAHEVLVLLPYRQIRERGFACADDDVPLLAMTVTSQSSVDLTEALRRLPEAPLALSGERFDVSDDDYAAIVGRVIDEAIGAGEGANFVVKRSVLASIDDYTPATALTVFRRLLEVESGAYWTFLIHTGGRSFIGATPERHLTVDAGTAVMNPISGTYRYPSSGPALSGLMDFLADRKESDELLMVLDEELKMMTGICEPGVRVDGPHLKQMARLAHTEYFIQGRTTRDVHDVLRETMFAPTVTGSPVQNACRIIHRYEPGARGYYSGVAAIIGHDQAGRQRLDSAIMIRTADIDRAGHMTVGVGATLVRHSDPDTEVAETRAKAAGLLGAFAPTGSRLATHPRVRQALARRNDAIADFWLGRPGRPAGAPAAALAGRRTLIVDAEDTFTAMLAHQLNSLDMPVTVCRHDEVGEPGDHDVVILGPGPGDPRDDTHPKIARLGALVDTLLADRRPFVAVCLSHQVLSRRLGLPLHRRDQPNQGVQKSIDLFGRTEDVGFYNTFAARSDVDTWPAAGIGPVDVCRDPATGEVHALRGDRFASMQFHAESVLTRNGPGILASFLAGVLPS